MGALDYLGPVKAPTRDIAAEIATRFDLPDYPSPYNGPVIWGHNAGGSEHGTGRALDFMVRNDQAVGDAIAEYVWEHRERLGLIHVIWRQRIKSTRVSPGVWRHMADRGSPTENHMDHPHCLFDGRDIGRGGGAQSEPPVVITRPDKDDPDLLEKGDEGKAVRALQAGLNDVFPAYSSLVVDGDFGPATESVVREFQERTGLTVDGLVGDRTRRELGKFGIDLGGAPKPKPRPKPKPKPSTSLLKRGSEGGEVRALQKGLNDVFPAYSDLAVDGDFGPATERVVKEFQKRAGLVRDGVIGAKTRAALRRYGIKA